MSLQKYKSTRETTNFARVARMILIPCTGVLCALLKKEVTPSALMHNVKTFIANYPKRRPCPINKDQEQLICGGNFSAFDITLLYTLLRNVSAIPQHLNNWGNDPEPGDRSVSANIERIRLIRNQYEHSSDASLTDTAFNKKYQDILTIIQELESYLGADTFYQDAVAHIKTCSMDPEQKAKYINQLHDVNIKLDYVLEEVQKAKTTSVPHSVSALYERDILEWKKEDCVFLETHNFPVMLNQVRQQPFVTFVGVPGSGKTTTVRHIALILQEEGYDILPIKEINKIEDYCSQNIPQVFVIDDMLGVFGLNEHELHMIEKYRERLLSPINPKTKTLMTCREAVFKNEMISGCILVENVNVVNLQSPENALHDVDKQNLLQKYKLDRDLLHSKHLASSSKMFPLLCKLYSSKQKFKCYGPSFFTSPIPCIIDEMNLLKTKNKLQYASLVLLMANKNKLSEKIFNNEKKRKMQKKNKETSFEEMKCRILDQTKVSSATDSFQFIDALSEMEGTYTKKSGDKFAFIHISIFEIIAYHFGKLFPDFILQYTSSNYIANYIKVDKDTKKSEYEKDQVCGNNTFVEKYESDTIMDLRIYLKESQYTMLAERLFRDVQNGKFYNVFENAALKHPSVVQCFIAVLEKKPYASLYHSLMSEFKNSSKIHSTTYKPAKCGVDEMKYMSLKKEADQLLIDERFSRFGIKTSYPNRSSVRGIKWVIRFGHYQILVSILNLIKQEKGIMDDLFLNCYNKRHQTSSNTNQNNPGTDVKRLLNQGKTGKLYEKTGNVGKDHKTDIDTDSDTHNCSKSFRAIEEDSYEGTDMDDDANVEAYYEPKTIEQCRLLCLACCSGDLNTVKTLLKHVNTDALNNTDCPSTVLYYFTKNPLIIACKYGFLDIVVELIKAGAVVNICVDNKTPLIAACENGHHSIERELLESGSNVNKNTGCYSTLKDACRDEHTLIVEEMIKAGADVNQNFPLFNACIKGHLCIVKKLIAVGASVNLPHHGDLPLLVACKKGYVNVVQELITAGADVNAIIKYIPSLVEVHDFPVYDNLMKAENGVTNIIEEETPLIAACNGGHFNVMKLLIKSGAKVDPKDNDYTTINFPCYWDHLNKVKKLIELESSFDLNDTKDSSLIDACYYGLLDVVKNMIKGGTDVNIKDGDKTPLIAACYKGNLNVVKELLEAGADVNLENKFVSPLQVACYEGHLSIVKELHNAEFNGNKLYSFEKSLLVACYCGHLSVVKELIAFHVEVNLKHGEETPLTNACYLGHLNIFEELIKAGADVNLNNGGRTPLALACYRGHINIVNELIKECANVNQNDGKETPLTAACEGRHVDVVYELIKAGADVNQSDGNRTPLTAACERGHWAVVEELINSGADANQSDGNKTPLTAACERGHWAIVEELIKAGADVNQSDGNKTPLTAAFGRIPRIVVKKLIVTGTDVNQSDENEILLKIVYDIRLWMVVKTLIDAGANVNQSDGNKTPLTTCEGEHWFMVPELIKAGADVNLSDGNKTPLTAACENGHVDVVKALIKAEADVNQSEENKTPLTAACESGHLDVVQVLIKDGANVNQSNGNKTPLAAACERRHWTVVRELIKAGAIVNQSDGNKTPLAAACERKHWTVVRELIKAGAIVNQSDGNKIPLADACERGHWGVVKALIRAKADVNQINGNKTPLTAVCENGHLNVVKSFIKAGADVNQSDGNKTPLTAACEGGHLNVVKTLIKAGANVNKSDGNKTPLTAACEMGCLIIVEKLIKAGADVNQSDGSKIPLTVACEEGHLKVVQELIKTGVNVNQSDGYNTAMTAAFERRHFEVVKELIRANVDID